MHVSRYVALFGSSSEVSFRDFPSSGLLSASNLSEAADGDPCAVVRHDDQCRAGGQEGTRGEGSHRG
eukprot:2520161-Pyramimonas_sp.AAC.1